MLMLVRRGTHMFAFILYALQYVEWQNQLHGRHHFCGKVSEVIIL